MAAMVSIVWSETLTPWVSSSILSMASPKSLGRTSWAVDVPARQR